VLAGSTVGLIAATLGRLYTSAFWALRDTRTPFRYAGVRVTLNAGLGWLFAFPAPRWLGLNPRFGLVGLTISAGIAAWLEFTLLRRTMNRRIGWTGLRFPYTAKLWSIAIAAAVPSFAVKYWTAGLSPVLSGIIVLLVFGIIYLAGAAALGIPTAAQMLRLIGRKPE